MADDARRISVGANYQRIRDLEARCDTLEDDLGEVRSLVKHLVGESVEIDADETPEKPPKAAGGRKG